MGLSPATSKQHGFYCDFEFKGGKGLRPEHPHRIRGWKRDLFDELEDRRTAGAARTRLEEQIEGVRERLGYESPPGLATVLQPQSGDTVEVRITGTIPISALEPLLAGIMRRNT